MARLWPWHNQQQAGSRGLCAPVKPASGRAGTWAQYTGPGTGADLANHSNYFDKFQEEKTTGKTPVFLHYKNQLSLFSLFLITSPLDHCLIKRRNLSRNSQNCHLQTPKTYNMPDAVLNPLNESQQQLSQEDANPTAQMVKPRHTVSLTQITQSVMRIQARISLTPARLPWSASTTLRTQQ